MIEYIPVFLLGSIAAGVLVFLIFNHKLKQQIKACINIEKKLKQANIHLAAIRETTLGLIGQKELDELLEIIIKNAAELINTPHAFIFLADSFENSYSETPPTIECKVGLGALTNAVGIKLDPGEGISGTVWQQGTPLIINDYPNWENRSPAFDSFNVKASLGVPLIYDDHTMGVIGLNRMQNDKVMQAFTEYDVELLQQFAQLASVVLVKTALFKEKHRAQQKLEDRINELGTLNRIMTTVVSIHDLNDILMTVATEMVNTLKSVSCGIALLNAEKTHLNVVAEYASKPDYIKAIGLDIPLKDNPSSTQVIETRQTIIVPRPYATPMPPTVQKAFRDANIQCLMIIPLIAHGEIFGTIGINTDQSGKIFSKEEVKLAETIAAQTAGAIYNARLFEEMERAKIAAELANRAKSTFLANISHELRTPLTAIIGYSELLIEDSQDEGHEDFIPDLQKIHTSGNHLLALINSVLDLAKVEAGKMELYLEEFNICHLIEAITITSGPLIEKKNNTLQINCSDDIGIMYADPTKTRQVLFNILSNAAKFTEQGTITLSINRHTQSQKEWIIFTITDTGIGIPKDRLENIFNAFEQADHVTARDFGGTGLGLAISRQYCKLMGGDIQVQSQIDVGTTFTIRLPAIVSETQTP